MKGRSTMELNLPTADAARRESGTNRQHNDELMKLEGLAAASIEAASSAGLRYARLLVRDYRTDLVYTLMHNLKDQGFATRLTDYTHLAITW